MLALLALLAPLSLLATTGSAKTIANVGYNFAQPPLDPLPPPYQLTETDTTLVAKKGLREARLRCSERGNVGRVVLCDILTFDECGNVDGMPGNTTQWTYAVNSLSSPKVTVRLNAPVVYRSKGVYRFYFTPSTAGVYLVTVWQDRLRLPSTTPTLRTGATMRAYVSVHDLLVRCTPFMDTMSRERQQVWWSQASFNNERRDIAGKRGPSLPTHTFEHRLGQYDNGVNGILQTKGLGRAPNIPRATQALTLLHAADNAHVQFCDMFRGVL